MPQFAEAISVSLAGLENLIVRSSLAAAQYAQDAPDFQRIGKEAEVDVILTGALLCVGEQLRLTTELVEVPSGTLLWSHSSQATVKQLLELHDNLLQGVVEALLPSLSAGEHASLRQDRPASATAYRLYLEANEFSRQWENLPAAIKMYEQCVSVDPNYAPAWARLGRARWLWDKYTSGSREGLRAANEAFQKALQLSPDLPLTHHLYTHLQVTRAGPKRLCSGCSSGPGEGEATPNCLPGLGTFAATVGCCSRRWSLIKRLAVWIRRSRRA